MALKGSSSKEYITNKISTYQKELKRVIAFASCKRLNTEKSMETLYNYDGFAVLSDVIRKDVYKAVKDCKDAGITVKMLTGDNLITAYSIAKELKIAKKLIVFAIKFCIYAFYIDITD